MTGAVTFRSFACTPAAARLGPALAASALMHLALLSAPLPPMPWRGAAPYTTEAPLTVRLAPLPVPVSDVPASPDPEARRAPRQPRPLAGDAERLRSEFSSLSAARPGTQAPALSRAPDPTYYTARDLDSYPRALAPLDVERLAGGGAGEVRLGLLIDERGIVRDITFEGSAVPARVQEALRTALVATLFIPASKDGRAVRSRIVLSVNFASASER